MIDYNPTIVMTFYPAAWKKKYIPTYEDIEKVLATASQKDSDYSTLSPAHLVEFGRLATQMDWY